MENNGEWSPLLGWNGMGWETTARGYSRHQSHTEPQHPRNRTPKPSMHEGKMSFKHNLHPEKMLWGTYSGVAGMRERQNGEPEETPWEPQRDLGVAATYFAALPLPPAAKHCRSGSRQHSWQPPQPQPRSSASSSIPGTPATSTGPRRIPASISLISLAIPQSLELIFQSLELLCG